MIKYPNTSNLIQSTMTAFYRNFALALMALIFTTTQVKSQCFVDAGNDTTFCQQQGQLFATPLFSSPNYAYSWSPTAGLNNPNTQNPLVVTGVSNQTYTVTMTDTVGGCTTSDTVTVSAYYFLADTVYSCFPDSFLLDFGPGAAIYNWQFFTDSNSVITALNVSTQTYWATEPGTYLGYATFMGCGALTSVRRVVDSCSTSSCSVNAGADHVNCLQPIQVQAIALSQGNDYTYSWSPSNLLVNPTSASAWGTFGGPGVHNQPFIVSMTDTVTGCFATDTVIVSSYMPSIDTFYSCQSSNVILDFGPGATNYYWQFFTDTAGNIVPITGSNQTLTVNQPGSYLGYAVFPTCGAITSVFVVEDSCFTFTCAVDAGSDTTFCQLQGQLNATPATPGNYTFSWSPSVGLSNPNIQSPIVVAGVNNQQYVVTMTDTANNCTSTDTIVVSAYYWHFDTVYICNGNPVTYDLGPGATQYSIQFTDTLGNVQFYLLPNELLVMTQPGTYLCIGTYIGCGSITSVITAIDSCNVQVGNVWPGDCNYDLVVNMADALHIGLAYGATGATRPNASNLWFAQPMVDWNQNYFNCNYKHGDADGNGVVNVNDTLPISLNYSLTHPFRLGAPQLPATAPTLQLSCSVDTVGLQTLVQVDVLLGTNTLTVDSLYGISFRITSDAGLIDTTLTVLNANTSWLGNDGVDMFTFRKQFQNSAIVDFAEVRNDHANRLNGSGPIASYFIVTTDNLSGIAVCHFNISDVTAVTASQTYVQFTSVNDSVVIDPSIPAGVSAVEQPIQFNMYPNPANDAVTIQTGGTATLIEICDMAGRVIESIQPLANKTQLDTATLATGMYLVRVTDGNTVSTQKLNISR